MRFRCVSLLAVAILLSLASFASATIVATLNVAYEGSYTADYSQEATLPVTTSPNATGGTLYTVMESPGNIYVNHSFEYYLTVTGLTSDQTVEDFLFTKTVTGATTVAAGDWALNDPTISPPSMGPPTSHAPSAPALSSNSIFNGTAWTFDLTTGTSTGGLPGNTFGDYAWAYKLGVLNTDLGNQIVNDNGVGSLSFNFKTSASTFGVLNGNTNGAALNQAAEAFITNASWTANSDSIAFAVGVPEPSTLALLGCGLFGLLAYAWRKRK